VLKLLFCREKNQTWQVQGFLRDVPVSNKQIQIKRNAQFFDVNAAHGEAKCSGEKNANLRYV
jgi:hypothetical protein